jgi:hypothetical protein
MQTNSPVLFLVFNRPALTAQVFTAIQRNRPPKLFIAADGPREGRNDEELCKQVRAIVTKVDWPCEVHTLFREVNLGCGKAVSEAISWFFGEVEQGIILEDDCLPDDSFFKFCDELLNKYANTDNVMAISGTSFLPKAWKADKQSYLFAHGSIWGWASWRRAWKLYNYDMPDWADQSNKDKIKKAIGNKNWFTYFFGLFEGTYLKQIDTWDVQWTHCIFNHGGLSINPSVNMVTNIGFGKDATHTGGTDSSFANMLPGKMTFPLKHPRKLEIDQSFMRASFRYVFNFDKSFTRTIKAWMRLYLNRMKKKNGL